MPIQQIVLATAATSFLVSSTAVNLKRIDGFFTSPLGTTTYLQIHDAKTLPANASVPKRPGILLTANYNFNQIFDEALELQYGCWLVLSSTQATLTLDVAVGDVMSCTADVDQSHVLGFVGEALTTVGDITTGVGTTPVQIWAMGGTNHFMRKIETKNSTGSIAYLQLFCYDTITAGDTPREAIPVPANQTTVLSFGFGASAFMQLQSTVSGTVLPQGTLRNGMTIAFSSTQNTYTPLAGNTMVLKVVYA